VPRLILHAGFKVKGQDHQGRVKLLSAAALHWSA